MENLTSNLSELYSTDVLESNKKLTVMAYANTVIFVLGIIFVVGIFLNLTSIIAIIRTKKLEPITLLILNLALADIVYIAGI